MTSQFLRKEKRDVSDCRCDVTVVTATSKYQRIGDHGNSIFLSNRDIVGKSVGRERIRVYVYRLNVYCVRVTYERAVFMYTFYTNVPVFMYTFYTYHVQARPRYWEYLYHGVYRAPQNGGYYVLYDRESIQK